LLLSQREKVYKTYITALVSRLYRNNLRCSFKATADAADKGKLYSIFSTAKISETKFCDDLKVKFTSPLGGIQQTGAPETAAKSVTPCFAFG